MDKNLQQLKREIDALKLEFDRKIGILENRVNAYQQTTKVDEDSVLLVPSTPVISQAKVSPTAKPVIDLTKAEEIITPVAKPVAKKPRKKINWAAILPTEMLESVFGKFTTYLKDVFDHYKKENKLPVFYMTILGIAAILFGAGYFIQYAYTSIFVELSPIIKISSGFAITTGVLGLGLHLKRRKKSNAEFASVLVSLAVVLNYLLIYFLSELPDVSIWFIYSAVVVNTVISSLLTIKLEAKIVAVLTLAGGTFCPIFLTGFEVPKAYFVYLLLLSAAMIFVARKINWQTLRYVIYASGLVVLESHLFLFESALSSVFGVTIVLMFSLLFFWDLQFASLRKVKFELPLKDIIWLVSISAAVALCYFELFDFNTSSFYLGLIFSGYGLLSGIPALVFRKKYEKRYWTIKLSLAFSYLCAAGLLFTDSHFLHLFLSLEALLLLYVGRSFENKSIQFEAFVLFVAAFVKSLVMLSGVFLNFSDLNWSVWSGFVGVAVTSSVAVFLNIKYGFKNAIDVSKYYIYLAYLTTVIAGLQVSLSYFAQWSPVVLIATTAIFFSPFNLKVARFHAQSSLAKSLLYVVVFFTSILVMTFFMQEQKDNAWLATELYYPFISLTVLLMGLSLTLKKREVSINFMYRRLATLLITVFVLENCYFALGHRSFLLLPVLGLALLFMAEKWADVLIRILSFIITGGLLLIVTYAALDYKIASFSELPLYAKLCAAEILLLLYFFKSINTNYLHNSELKDGFVVLRKIFFLLLPVILVGTVQRYLPDLLVYGLWLATIATYFLFTKTKVKALVFEYYALVVAAIGVSIFSHQIVPFVVGIASLAIVYWREKAYEKRGNKGPWLIAHIGMFYFAGLSLFLGISTLLDLGLACALTATYFIILLTYRKSIVTIRNQVVLLYVASLGFQAFSFLSYTAHHTAFVVVINAVLLAANFYKRQTIFIRNGDLAKWRFNFPLVHLMILMSYSVILGNLFPSGKEVVLTLLMVVHAIFLLFHDLKTEFKFVNKVYIPFFVIILAKLFFHDLHGFSVMQKVIVLIISGTLLLGGSFVFLKIKEKYSDQGHSE